MKLLDVDKEFSDLSFNARLLLKEMIKRNIKLQYIKGTDVVKASLKSHKEILFDVFTSMIPYPSGILVDDKYYAKKILLSNGINVAPGEVFTAETREKAVDYAEKIGFPVVLKPTVGSHGDHVFLKINNKKELREKISHFLSNNYGNEYYLIEKYSKGNEYRLFVTTNGFFACVSRVPANVIGDGEKNLKQLIEAENYRRMNPRTNCLCEIRVDELTLDFLKKNKLNLNYIPKKNERVFIRFNSNVTTGGNCYEVTPLVNREFVELSKIILKIFKGLPFIGIDILCADISKPIKDYIVCELNCAPGLSMHMLPEKGKPQNVAKEIVDVIFPESV